MKKLCLSILAMILLFPSAMFAEEDDVKIGNLWYNLIDKAKVAEVTDCDRNAVNVVVPSTVNYNEKTYKVERIREKAFSSNQKHIDNRGGKKIKSLQLPEGIIEICEEAFDGSDIESVNIPKSVTHIGESAFSGCSKLSSIIVLTNIDRVEGHTFSGCSSLTSVTLSDKVTYIGHSAFAYCKKLENITIPNSVTTIDVDAFQSCSSLKSINIPKSVINIHMDSFGNAFANCESVTSIVVAHDNPIYDSRDNCNAIIETWTNTLVIGCKGTKIPTSVTAIGDAAFAACYGIQEITIPNSITIIGDGAFRDCINLKTITLPNSITSIGKEAFQDCFNLTEIILPNSLTTVSESAFRNSGLTEIKIPNSVISIESYAFSRCKLSSFTLPNSIAKIGSYAFNDCDSLKTFVIGETVSEIGDGILSSCNNLTSIIVKLGNTKYDSRENCNAIIETESNTLISACLGTLIPNGITAIGNGSFRGYRGFTSITIPSSVTHIGEDSFRECAGLTSITLPNSIRTIEKRAFADCHGLAYVISEIDSPFDIDESVFKTYNVVVRSGDNTQYNTYKRAILKVPVGTKTKYQATNYWNKFTNIVEDGANSITNSFPNTCQFDVYNLNGNKLKSRVSSLDGLQSGIYIIDGKKVIK